VIVLRDYQEQLAHEAKSILSTHGLVLLLMQVRTGKTLTALRTCELMRFKSVLFATKKAVITSVQSDYQKGEFDFRLHVTNYEQLEKLNAEFDCVIVDEFHSFGAFPVASQRTKTLRTLCESAAVIMLSGTPTPESFSQLFHPLWASHKGPWKSYKNFYSWAKHYVKVKLKYLYNRQINDYSQADIVKIESDIKPYCLYFTQSDAGFNVVTNDEVLTVPMPPVLSSAIRQLKKDKIITTSQGVVLGDTAVKLMSKVHQLSSGTVKTEEGNIIAIDNFKAKFIRDKFEGKKIAIFYKYIGERKHLESVFSARLVEAFNNGDATRVYISQIMSGREGINLSTADALIMYNIDFSALSYWQARERPQSKDRTDALTVYWVMSEDGIEQRIYNVVQQKKDFTVRHFSDFGTTATRPQN
jgi:hypothetical protein